MTANTVFLALEQEVASRGWTIGWEEGGTFSLVCRVTDKRGRELARCETVKASWWEEGDGERRMREAEAETVAHALRIGDGI